MVGTTPSRPVLIIGNIIAITVTIAAFAQTLSWTIAGVLILVSLILPLLVNIAPAGAQLTARASPRMPSSGHDPNSDKSSQQKLSVKHSLSNTHSATKTEPKPLSRQQSTRTPLPSHGLAIPTMGPPRAGPPGAGLPPSIVPPKQGPNLNPTIAKDDYMEYEVELEQGGDFHAEVTADGLVNAYLLDEENMDNLDEGEEFWSETGQEGSEMAEIEFTASSKGKWFFVVENADDRAVVATVKMNKGPTSAKPA